MISPSRGHRPARRAGSEPRSSTDGPDAELRLHHASGNDRSDGGYLPGPSGDPEKTGGDPTNMGRQWLRLSLVLVVALFLTSWLSQTFLQPSTDELTYSGFLGEVEAGDVASVTIGPEGRIEGERTDGSGFTTVAPTALDDSGLVDQLRDAGVEIDATAPTGGGLLTLIANLLPFLLLVGVFWWMMRRARGQMGQFTGLGRSKAKEVSQERPDVTFDDIAGYDGAKEEISEVVAYLRDPDRFRKLGARGPGGLLLVGPPGTGKTLFARAVAGEAHVPFFSAAGSEFVEMIVGVGASRVRDLFDKARKQAPSIVFIDELDSIGRRRGSQSSIGSNNEQEQTLNQLLSELDGFDPREGVVVMAATNRAEMLDPALTRPGRFDREIEIPAPVQGERLAILRLHTAGKPLAGDVDLGPVARGTPGFTGADLENLVNEAAFAAARADRSEITQDDLDLARDRTLLGRRQDSSVLRDDERHRVAVHEGGHAVVAALIEDADPVAKVTILPTRRALGVTEQLPLDERRLYPEGYLRALLAVRLGGRVAEHLCLGSASSGAANDLAGATHIATRMVRDFGLSEQVGPVSYAPQDHASDGDAGVPPAFRERPYADATQRGIDEEVVRLVREAEKQATALLEQHRDALEDLAQHLLDEETVPGRWVYDRVGRTPPG